MKRELSVEEQEASDKIFQILIGFTVEQAKFILKTLANSLDEHAVIEED